MRPCRHIGYISYWSVNWTSIDSKNKRCYEALRQIEICCQPFPESYVLTVLTTWNECQKSMKSFCEKRWRLLKLQVHHPSRQWLQVFIKKLWEPIFGDNSDIPLPWFVPSGKNHCLKHSNQITLYNAKHWNIYWICTKSLTVIQSTE